MKLVQLCVTAAIAFAAAWITAKSCADRWNGNLGKIRGVGCTVTVLAALASMLMHGLGMHNVQTVFLSCIFLYASYGDRKTHEADDFIHVLVLAVALISKQASDIPQAFLTVAVTAGAMFLVAVFVKGAGIGGADIKFCAACAFLMPTMNCLIAMLLGMFLGLVFNSPFRRKREGEEPKGFPMLPYLSCGYMLIFLFSFPQS